MTISPTAQTFLQLVDRSQLIAAPLLEVITRQAVTALKNTAEPASAATLAAWLVENNYLTSWQTEKLLQGKHRGFFLGPYRLLSRIARGGMSTIYSAEHTSTKQVVALKVLPLSKVSRSSYLPRFLREADIAKRLSHPNIVQVYDIHAASDGVNQVHFMAMELLSGNDLYDVIRAEGPLPCRAAADYIRQASQGLAYAHSAGLVHRDIKPGNLFRTTDGVIKILDLGLAQDFDSEENLTREFNERVLGTADYLSPEQAIDSHMADTRADIYSLGCTLFFLLTGQPPFNDGTLTQRIMAHQTRQPPPLSELRRDVPEELQTIVTEMMHKDRTLRLQSAEIVSERLADWLRSTSSRKDLSERPADLMLPGSEIARAEQPRFKSSASLDAFLNQSAAVAMEKIFPNRPDDQSYETSSLPRSPPRRSNVADLPAYPDAAPPRESPYVPEFESFLHFLDDVSGVTKVFRPEIRRADLRSAANRVTEPTAVPIQHSPDPPVTSPRPPASADSTAVSALRSPLQSRAVQAILVAAMIAAAACGVIFRAHLQLMISRITDILTS